MKKFKDVYGYEALDYYHSLIATGMSDKAQLIMDAWMELEHSGLCLSVSDLMKYQDAVVLSLINKGITPIPDTLEMEIQRTKSIKALKEYKETKAIKMAELKRKYNLEDMAV